jgi:hypothetical protein
MAQLSPKDQEMVDRLVEIDGEIKGMMKTGLAGGKVDLKRLGQLQEELTTLLDKVKDNPAAKSAYNQRVGSM